jgi:predicted ATPase
VSVKGKEDPQHRYILLKSSDVKTRIDASVSKGLVRFVGRKNSMAAVRNAWDKAINGSGQVLGVVGEAGVGKSRLLLEFREALENTDFNYFEGRCIHYGGSMAYLPILDILKAFFKIEEGQREYIINKSISEKLTTLDAERLTDSRPAFQDLLSIKVEDESWLKLEPKIRKEHTFEALRNLFIRLSEERPLIIAVEDLHWMDKTSEEFLTYFINSLAHSPVLLILLYRPEYTHQWGSKSYYSKIGLDQLTMKSSAELVSAILEGGEVASDLTEHILKRSAGNPLFMEEFTYALLENGSIERKDNQFVLTENFENIQVPDTIQGIIAARMDRLEDSLKRTMQVASVIGRDFAFRILQTITGMREELKSYLMNLQGLEFIYEKSLFPELEYIFKHALTQEVAYNSLLLAKRKNIHERIGKAIEEIYSNRLDELYEMLAYHFSKSENLEKAYHYLKLAGQKAYRNNANWDAYRFYEKAIKLLEKMPESDENTRNKIETCLLIAAPSSVLGYPEKSLEILLQGESLSKRIGDRRSLARSCRNLAHCFSIRGDHQKSMQYSERCFQDAKEIEDVGLTATVARELCLSHFWYGNLLKMAEIAIPAISLLEEKEKQYQDFDTRSNTYSALCAYCVQAYGLLGNFAEAKSFYDKGIKIVNELNDKYGIAWIYFCYAVSCGLEGNGKICIQLANDAIKKTEEVCG